jgi:hypothetical protein
MAANRDIAGDPITGAPITMPVDVEDAGDARMLIDGLERAMADPVNVDNFKAACRRRIIQLKVALGQTVVDIVGEIT